jgi:drug/metabolite transporter (DMT)-like permease
VPTSSTRSAYVAWAAVCLIWGTTYLGIRVALETIPPLLMTGLRWSAAGALILGALAVRGVPFPPRQAWPQLALLGILFMGVGNGGVVWAEQYIPSGLAAVLVAAIPFYMVGVERFMPESEPLTARKIVGLVVGFAGIVLLVWPELKPGAGRGFLLGVIATQVACLGWAIGSSYSRRRHAAENVFAAAGLQMLLSGVIITGVGTLAGEWSALSLTPRTVTAVVYLAIVGSVIGFLAYAYALKHLPVATVSLYAYINPIIAVILGTIILGEPLSPRLALAGAIVFAGSVLVKGK